MAGRASASGDEMPSSSRIRINPWSGRPGGASPVRSSPTPIPTTPPPKAKGKRSRDGQTILPSLADAAFVLDGPGEYEVRDVLLTGVSGRTATTRRAPTAAADRVPRRARRAAHDPPRRDRSPPDRGEARGHRHRSTSRARPDRRPAHRDQDSRTRRPARPEDRRGDAARGRHAGDGRRAGEILPRDGRRLRAQPRLSVTISSLPSETTAVLLESRGKPDA